MPALETFDWFMNQIEPRSHEGVRKYLEEQRQYLLNIRNENERRRFVEEVMLEARAMLQERKN
ncbi:MAG: hypothetical protein HY563_06050 [Ignavibacteriales bacterium]|nr:hypothetical protein [Ignavibacteriales bacterium]